MKVCNTCHEEKEDRQFYTDKASKDGLNRKCRSCTSDYTLARKRRLEGGERVREINRVIAWG